MTSFVNNYRPPALLPSSDSYGPDPWDINFCLPVNIASLENTVLKLTPFIPRLHLDAFWAAGGGEPNLYRFIRQRLATPDDVLSFLLAAQADPTKLPLLIIDKTRPDASGLNLGGAVTGMLSYMTTSAANLARPVYRHVVTNAHCSMQSTEIGFVIILKSAQRTHVTTNACGLLLQHALDPPSRGGLGLRRVQWTCDAGNMPSQRTAARLGFRREGILRWLWVLPAESTAGEPPRADDVERGRGRHDVYHSICWDDWVGGAREALEMQMARRA
jgi:hypothetical protein